MWLDGVFSGSPLFHEVLDSSRLAVVKKDCKETEFVIPGSLASDFASFLSFVLFRAGLVVSSSCNCTPALQCDLVLTCSRVLSIYCFCIERHPREFKLDTTQRGHFSLCIQGNFSNIMVLVLSGC